MLPPYLLMQNFLHDIEFLYDLKTAVRQQILTTDYNPDMIAYTMNRYYRESYDTHWYIFHIKHSTQNHPVMDALVDLTYTPL